MVGPPVASFWNKQEDFFSTIGSYDSRKCRPLGWHFLFFGPSIRILGIQLDLLRDHGCADALDQSGHIDFLEPNRRDGFHEVLRQDARADLPEFGLGHRAACIDRDDGENRDLRRDGELEGAIKKRLHLLICAILGAFGINHQGFAQSYGFYHPLEARFAALRAAPVDHDPGGFEDEAHDRHLE